MKRNTHRAVNELIFKNSLVYREVLEYHSDRLLTGYTFLRDVSCDADATYFTISNVRDSHAMSYAKSCITTYLLIVIEKRLFQLFLGISTIAWFTGEFLNASYGSFKPALLLRYYFMLFYSVTL